MGLLSNRVQDSSRLLLLPLDLFSFIELGFLEGVDCGHGALPLGSWNGFANWAI